MKSPLSIDQIKDVPRTTARFHRSYRVDPDTGCWIWTVSPGSRYAVAKITTKNGAAPYQASHLSLVLYGRPLSDGQVACHRCDNPRCVAPEHLFAGTHDENMADMVSKGRKTGKGGPSGERNGRAKLSRRDVDHIRSMPTRWGLLSELAEQYGVTPGAIKRIRDGDIWK